MTYQPKSYRKFLATSVAAAMVATAVAPAAIAAADVKEFPDVVKGSWYEKNVNYLVERGIIEGNPDGTFGPQNGVTRAQAAIMIARALELEVPANPTLGFSDTNNDAWYAGAVAALVDLGVVEGNPDGTFAPNATITRAALAKMIVEAFELEANDKFEADFNDTVAGAWYEDYVVTLASLGIVGGYNDGTFKPNATVNRAEAAAFFHRTEVAEERLEVELGVVVVETVEAATKEVLSGQTTAQYLTVTVNGGEEVTVEELVEAGYEVEFVATQSVFSTLPREKSATGQLRNNLTAGTKFEYKVTVSQDGELVAESTLREVKVVDAEQVGIEASDYTLLATNNSVDYKITSNTLTLGDGNVRLAEIVFTNTNGTETKENQTTYASKEVKFSSSDNTVATISANGTITPIKAGAVDIKIKKGDIEKIISITVVSESRKATTATSELSDFKIVAKTNATAVATITVFDQFGDAFAGAVTREEATDADNRQLTRSTLSAVPNKDGERNLTVNARTTTVEGEGEILIKAGSSTLLVLPVFLSQDDKIVERKLEVAINSKSKNLELDAFGTDNNELTLSYNGYNKDGFLVKADTTTGLTAKTSDDKVASATRTATGVQVVAKGEGTAVISLTEGAVTRASVTVEVKDTTPKVVSVEFQSGLEITYTEAKLLSDVLKTKNISLSHSADIQSPSFPAGTTQAKLITYYTVGGQELGTLELRVVPGAKFAEGSNRNADNITFATTPYGIALSYNGQPFAAEDRADVVLTFKAKGEANPVAVTTLKIDVPKASDLNSPAAIEKQIEKIAGNKVTAQVSDDKLSINAIIRADEKDTKIVDAIDVAAVKASGLMPQSINGVSTTNSSDIATEISKLVNIALGNADSNGAALEGKTLKALSAMTLEDLEKVGFITIVTQDDVETTVSFGTSFSALKVNTNTTFEFVVSPKTAVNNLEEADLERMLNVSVTANGTTTNLTRAKVVELVSGLSVVAEDGKVNVTTLNLNGFVAKDATTTSSAVTIAADNVVTFTLGNQVVTYTVKPIQQ